MYEDLKGKVALITGAGNKRGIGYAVAQKFAGNGSHVIVSDILPESSPTSTMDRVPQNQLQEIADGLAKDFHVKTLAVPLDVTDHESIRSMVETVSNRFPTIDVLVNNAGIALGIPSEIRNYDEEAWLKTFDINLHGAFRVSRAILPLMKGKDSCIINMSSRAGKVPPLWNGAYAVSKAGLIMLTKVMALELAPSGIRVNAVCPGLIMTDFQQHRLEIEAQFTGSSIEERKKILGSRVPQERLGSAEEVASLTVYLTSKESSYLTGQAINVCGGLTMEL